MITCRTPLRISLFGGGTDFPDWYKKNESLIISGSIDKYCYINVRKLPFIWNFKFRLRYHKSEIANSVSKIQHGPYREIIKYFNLQNENIEMIHTADLPALSGLGASSSSTVCAINALSTLKQEYLSKKQISQIAIFIEQTKLKENVGSQDQIATAFGGFNKIAFNKDLDFTVENLLDRKKLDILNESIFLVYTGIQRKSANIEREKINNLKKNKLNDYLNEINKISFKALKEFRKRKLNLKRIGKLLSDQWEQKKLLARNVSNPTVEKISKICLNNGAYGTKLLGAGGGGFVLVLFPSKKKKNLMKKLKKYKTLEFRFENTGTNIIYQKN